MNYYEHLNSLKDYMENGSISFKEFEIEILDVINESTCIKREQKDYIDKFIEENGICFSDDFKYITEINTFKKKDTGINIAIGVFGDGLTDRGFAKDPYFKISDKDNFKGKKRTRISMQFSEYVIHDNDKWELSNKICTNLYNFLINKNSKGKTNWEKLREDAIRVSKDPETTKKIIPLTPPHYDEGIKMP